MSTEDIKKFKEDKVKLVTAILRPENLDQVREALCDVDIPGMTVTEVKGFGKQKGHTELYRGTEFTVEFVHKVKLEIAISNKNLDLLINTISDIARSGKKVMAKSLSLTSKK